MSKGRLEAFSDGVLAIIITIMVLELKPPHGPDLYELWMLAPVFFSYVLSFVYVGIYWNNHHHLLHASEHVSGGILWANLHVLFWLSLVPFSTAWMGEQHFAALPVALYGLVLLFFSDRVLFPDEEAHRASRAQLTPSGVDWKGQERPNFVSGLCHRDSACVSSRGFPLLVTSLLRSCGYCQTLASKRQ